MANQSTTFGRAPMPPSGYDNRLLKGIPSPRLLHTGSQAAALTADFNNTTPGASTEVYFAELFAPTAFVTTGAAGFNGSDTTDTTKIALFDAQGTILLATASTQQATADVYQRLAWAKEFITVPGTATSIVGPVLLPAGTYYLGQTFGGTTSRFQTFVVGNFGAGKVTSTVYATAFDTTTLSITPPTTFTTILGPVISLY